PGLGVVPRVESAPCKFEVAPSLGVEEGTDYVCGNLVVYESRVSQLRVIRLHYIQFKKAATPAQNAAIYLDGGPGGDGEGIVSYANFLGPSFLQGLMTSGDFLVIGQRGTGLSKPFLDCQTADCSDFAAIADLRSYNTESNADDVDELRSTLGYETLDLYGISYGSRLGLEVLRRHGDHLRSATIEGLVPSQVVWPAAVPASFYSALTGLNTSCAAAGECGTLYGDLTAKFTTGVDALNANPAPVTTSQGEFELDGYTYAYLLFQMFYSKSTFPYLPLMISDLAVRRTDRIGNVLEAILGNSGGSGISTGLYNGVVCSELFNPPNPSAFDDANADVPAAIRDLFAGNWFGMLETCANYPKTDPVLQTQLQQPVVSSVRSFVSSGRLDPITPPSFGVIAAASLSDSFHVIHENSGHGATLQSDCGQRNLFAFLADPSTPIDTSCAATISGDFIIGSNFVARPVPVARIRAELRLAPIPPFMRRKI
ncbi:MAG: alpha/beta fold hydrolase, partial [Deltaproteobacteria bacterium]|nr:alpha/beta fold hydrolase [Deltaproteobacteria bacterium]